MLSHSRRAALLIAAYASAQATTVFGQESLRNSLDFDRMNGQRQQNLDNQVYNMRLGPVVMTLSAGTTVNYNDNINLSENAPKEDVSFHPGVQTAFIWQMSEHNQLAVDLNVSYAAYINNPALNKIEVNPNSLSDISYDIFVGAVRFNLHDRFSYTESPLSYGSAAVSGEPDLGRFVNSIGVTSLLRLSEGSISIGYDHNNNVFFNKTFANTDSSAELVFVRGSYNWNPTLTIGLETSGGMTTYAQKVRPDNRNYTVGPFANWRLTSAISLEARAGLSGYQLASRGALGDQAAPLSYYASLSFKHQVNKQVAQSLVFSRDTSQGIGFSANFLEILSVRHTATWNIIANTTLSTELSYERSDDASKGAGLFKPESYSRYGGGVTIGYQVLRQLTANLAYSHLEKDSTLAGGSYGNNLVTLGLSYRF